MCLKDMSIGFIFIIINLNPLRVKVKKQKNIFNLEDWPKTNVIVIQFTIIKIHLKNINDGMKVDLIVCQTQKKNQKALT